MHVTVISICHLLQSVFNWKVLRNDINKSFYCVWRCCQYPQGLQSIIHVSVPLTSRRSVENGWMDNWASFWHRSYLSPIVRYVLLDSTAAIAPQFWRDITNNSGLLSFQNTESCNLFPVHVQNVKPFQLQGGFAPLTPTGALPVDPAGALPPDPRYRLALRARHAFRQINICQYTIEQNILFSRTGAKFAGSVGHPMIKMLSASGGLCRNKILRNNSKRKRIYSYTHSM